MEEKALLYIKQALDKATQKGTYTLDEVANIIACMEELKKAITKKEE